MVGSRAADGHTWSQSARAGSVDVESSFTVARIRGIPIGVHYTWADRRAS